MVGGAAIGCQAAPQLAMLPIKSVRKIIRRAYRVLPLLCIAAHRRRLYYGHAGATARLQHAVHLACCKLGHGHMLHSQAASLLHGPAGLPGFRSCVSYGGR